MLIILYGPPGSGKNFVGEWIACRYGFHFYDADVDLTEEMKQCLYQKQPFTQKMRDYFFDVVIDQMKRLRQIHPKLVMAQAISRKVNREQLYQAFPEAQFIHIDASPEMRLRRLAERGGWVTPDWVDKLLSIQEPADAKHRHLDNSQDYQHLAQQADGLLLFM